MEDLAIAGIPRFLDSSFVARQAFLWVQLEITTNSTWFMPSKSYFLSGTAIFRAKQ
jgi:hypothetical protein